MKIIISLIIAFSIITNSHSQINIGQKIKDKVKQRADQKVDKAIDEGLDKAEDGAKNSTKKKTKTETEDGKTKTKTKTEDEDGVKTKTESDNNSSAANASFTSYSKFDFVPGDQVTFFDDFSQDAIGDFPPNWNTDGSGEVVTLGSIPGKWLKLMLGNSYGPMLKNSFPDNFTLEYDMIVKPLDGKEDPDFTLIFYSSANKNFDKGRMAGEAGVYADFWRDCLIQNWSGGENNEIGKSNSFKTADFYGKKVHYSIWAQKQRIRVYVNETKIIDLPRAIPENIKLNKIKFDFSSELDQSIVGGEIYISNVRIAVGAPDMRSKLITEGKLVTRGILFDINSDKIKPESYGTLKEIAQVLKDNATVKVKIIGHTDSDGSAATNLDLSKRRSASVKNSLSKDFGIDASRMETDGKGASEPASPNTTPEGKANNRRVEFIKM